MRHLMFFLKTWLAARHADGILSFNAVSAGVPATWVSRITGKKLVLRVAGDYAWEIAVQTGATYLMVNEFQQSQKTRRIRRLDRLQRAVVGHAAAVIVPSNYLSDVVAGWGVPVERIHVIYNGVDLPPVMVTKEEARRTLGISGISLYLPADLFHGKDFACSLS